MFGKKHHSIQRPHFAMALSITILLFCSLSLTAGANETEEQRIETFELDSYLSDATLSSASIVLHDQAQAMRGLHHIVFDIFRGVGDEDYLNVEDMRILAAVNAWNSTTCVRWHHLPKGGRAWVDDQNRRVLHLDTHKLLFVGTPGKPCRLLRRGTRTAPIFFEVLVGECGTHRLTQLLGQVLGLGAITSPEQYTMSADNMKTLTQYVPVIPWDGESVMQRPEVYFSVLSADPEQYASHIGIRQGVSKGDIWAVNFLFNSCATQPSEESSMKPKISCSSSFTDNPDFPVVVTTGQRVLIHFVGRLTAPGADVAELSHEVIANPTYESASLHTALQTRYSVSHTQVITLSWIPVHNEDAPKQTIGVKFHTLSGATEVEETCRVTFKVVEHTCFGIENSDKSKVCNGRGVCDKRDHCFCDPGYKGTQCQYSTTCPNGNLFWPLSTRPVNDSAVLAMGTEGSLGKAAQIVFEASAPNHSALMIPYGFREQFQIPELTVPQHISLYFRAAGRAAWTCQPRVILSSLNTTCSKLQLSHQGWFLDGKYIAATPNLDEWHFIEFTVNHQSKLVRVYVDGVILALARGEVYSCISKGISTLDVSCPTIMQESVEEDDFHSAVDDSSVLISQVRLSCMNVIHVDEPESRLIDSRFYHGTRKGITSNIKLSLKGVGEMYRWNLNEFRSEDLAVLSPQSKSHSVFLRNVTLGNPVSVDQSTTGESVSISVPFQAHPEKSSEHSTVISEDIWLVPSLSMFSGIIPTNTLQPTVLDISSLRFRIAGTCPSNYAWTDMRSWRYRKPQNELEGEDIVFFPAKICRHPDAHVNTCAELRRGSLDIKLPEVMAPKTFSIHFRRVHPGRTAWFDVQLKSKEVKTRTFHSSEAKFINLRVSIRNHELSIFFQGVSSAPIPYSSDESKVNHNPDSELEWDLLEIAFHEVNGDLKAMSCSLAGALNVLEEVPISIPKVSRLSISGTNVQVALPKLTCPVVNPIVRVGLGKENVFSDYTSDQPVQLLIHAGSSSIKHALLSAVTENSLPKYYWLEKTHIGSSMKQVVTRFRALDDHRVQLGVVFDGFQETVNALTLTVKGIPWYNPVQKSTECTSLAWCNHHGNPYFDNETNRCLCQCEGRFTGDRCDRCQEAFTGSSCAQCRLKGSYPDCRSCDEYCNAPRGKGAWDASGRCTCTCNAQFSGEDCSACHDSFSGPDCTQCAVGFTRRGEQCSKCLPHSLEPECNGEL